MKSYRGACGRTWNRVALVREYGARFLEFYEIFVGVWGISDGSMVLQSGSLVGMLYRFQVCIFGNPEAFVVVHVVG